MHFCCYLEYLETKEPYVLLGNGLVRYQSCTSQGGRDDAKVESAVQGRGRRPSGGSRGGAGTKSKRKSKNWLVSSKLENAGVGPRGPFFTFWHSSSA